MLAPEDKPHAIDSLVSRQTRPPARVEVPESVRVLRPSVYENSERTPSGLRHRDGDEVKRAIRSILLKLEGGPEDGHVLTKAVGGGSPTPHAKAIAVEAITLLRLDGSIRIAEDTTTKRRTETVLWEITPRGQAIAQRLTFVEV